jgi:uncharacterized membrane-anchored protein
MTKFIIPCSQEQLKKITEDSKKYNKTFIKYVLDKLLDVDVKENKEIEKTFKKAIKEIRKEKENNKTGSTYVYSGE